MRKFETGSDLGKHVKEKGEALKLELAKAQMSRQQASSALASQTGSSTRKLPDSPFAQPANPTPATGSNSAFNRGLDAYQAQQAAAQVDTMNAELDRLFAQTMARD